MAMQRDPEGTEVHYLQTFANFENAHILEVGCGDGRMTRRYAQYPRRITAIDPDHNRLRTALATRPQSEHNIVTFVLSHAEKLPFAAQCFDGAILAWSLWWIPRAGMVHALNEIRRVLISGGYLIDLRPFTAKPPIEIVSGDKIIPAGFVDDSHDVPNDLAADNAVEYMTANGLFAHEQNDTFELYTYWDTITGFKIYMDTGTNSILPAETLATVEQLLSQLGSTARIRERLDMMITRYRKTTPAWLQLLAENFLWGILWISVRRQGKNPVRMK